MNAHDFLAPSIFNYSGLSSRSLSGLFEVSLRSHWGLSQVSLNLIPKTDSLDPTDCKSTLFFWQTKQFNGCFFTNVASILFSNSISTSLILPFPKYAGKVSFYLFNIFVLWLYLHNSSIAVSWSFMKAVLTIFDTIGGFSYPFWMWFTSQQVFSPSPISSETDCVAKIKIVRRNSKTNRKYIISKHLKSGKLAIFESWRKICNLELTSFGLIIYFLLKVTINIIQTWPWLTHWSQEKQIERQEFQKVEPGGWEI